MSRIDGRCADFLAGLYPCQGWKFNLLATALCFLAYLPAVDNGFISDDFIMLNWAEQWRGDFFFLFRIVPDVFRITGYVVLRFLQGTFGYHSEYFYIFSILVHALNTVLLSKLLAELTGSLQVAAVAALLYAVVQNPQEAVFWLAALADALAGLFVIASLLAWVKNRHVLAAVLYIAGLFSKESGAVALLLLPLVEFCIHGRLAFRRRHLYYVVPTLAYVILFAVLNSQNYLFSNGSYSYSFRGPLVLLVSIHRLMFPWFYLAVVLFFLNQRGRLPQPVLWGVAWMTVAILPFIFLTYQNHIPSRHSYMASMGLAWGIAALLDRVDRAWAARAFVAAFIAVNVSYLWFRKDAHFEQRAAPTEQLLAGMRRLPPQPTMVADFPLNPWMAKMAANMVPGWRPELLHLEELDKDCPGCPVLRWDPAAEKYDFSPSAPHTAVLGATK
jgi:hypothetical protein